MQKAKALIESVNICGVIFFYSPQIDELYFLSDKIYFQPEGICIDDNYALYISSEGRTKKSRLFEFAYNKKR